MIKNISLDEEEWQKVMAVLATAPWNIANPLLMKIGDQLRMRPDNIQPIPKESRQ